MAQNYTDLQRDQRKGHFTGFPTNVPGTPDTVIPDDPEGIVSTLPSLIENVNVVGQDPQPLMDPARFLQPAGYPTIATGPAAGTTPSIDEDFLKQYLAYGGNQDPITGTPPLAGPISSMPTALLQGIKKFPALHRLFGPLLNTANPRFTDAQGIPFRGQVSGYPIGSRGYHHQQLRRGMAEQHPNAITQILSQRSRGTTPPVAGGSNKRWRYEVIANAEAARRGGTPSSYVEYAPSMTPATPGGGYPPALIPHQIARYLMDKFGLGGAASQSPEIEEFLNQTKHRQDPIR